MEKILVIEEKYRSSLGSIRHIAGLKAAQAGGLIWLRGIRLGDKPDPLISALPILHNYQLDEQQLLFPEGKLTPIAQLPVLNWVPLKTFFSVTLPVAALPGSLKEGLFIKLRGSVEVREPIALLVELSLWRSYAETAPQTRLNPLRFAVSAAGQALIIGPPPPPLPGQLLWERDGLLLPLGFDIDPPLLAELLPHIFTEFENGYRLFSSDNQWQNIPFVYFQPARRSAVRLTVIGHD